MRCFLAFLMAAGLTSAADFTTGQAARLVIGQKTFTAQDATASASVVGAGSGLAYANGLLFVSDANRVGAEPANHRVLVFDTNALPKPTDIIDREQSVNTRCPVCVGTASLVLGQTDFAKTELGIGQDKLRLPIGVATDGVRLAVADTDNNRVLIWNTIPTTNGAPTDIVVGQADFKSNASPRPPSNKSLRGPQGVWIQNGKLYVADTMNNRVLVWNSIPSSNGQAADLVLGQPDFSTYVEPDLTKTDINVKANTLLNPVSVTSDGQRLYVADLGHNRVVIWNSLPTQNQQSADIALGQPDVTSAVANNSPKVCQPTGKKDTNGNDIYPVRCSATMDFPRYALSDGRRLFVADGGNDRVLIYNSIPTASGVGADVVLGQLSGELNSSSDSADPLRRSSSDSLRTPMAVAFDGTNLYVTDTFNRRVLVYTVAEPVLPFTAVRNAASLQIFSVGTITFSGSIKADDEVTITIHNDVTEVSKEYKYKVLKDDTLGLVVARFVALINEGDGDPNVFATPNIGFYTIVMRARKQGIEGNDVFFEVTATDKAAITWAVSSANLSGGADAAKIAPGSLISILGDNLTDRTASAPADAENLPTELGGVRVYIDGIQVPLLFVSPGQINAQLPWEVLDATGLSAYVRTEWSDGRVTISNPVAVPVISQNPGIFTYGGTDPRPAVALHYSNYATGTISLDGTAVANEIATVTIYNRTYEYKIVSGDTLSTVADALINLINQDPEVTATKATAFGTPGSTLSTTRIRLKARYPGTDGTGVPYSVKVTGSALTLTATGSATCCTNVAGSLVTEENPAVPGETIIVYATGLGLVKPDEARLAIVTGGKFTGTDVNEPNEMVSSLVGAKTANLLQADLMPGMVGIYEVHLELNSDLPTNPVTQMTLAQDVYVSNIATIPIYNPKVILTVAPNTGQPGQQNLSVTITAQNTTFVQGTSGVSFGAGITVGTVTVTDLTHLTAVISIDSSATTGTRTVTVTTDSEVVSLADAFTVTSGT